MRTRQSFKAGTDQFVISYYEFIQAFLKGAPNAPEKLEECFRYAEPGKIDPFFQETADWNTIPQAQLWASLVYQKGEEEFNRLLQIAVEKHISHFNSEIDNNYNSAWGFISLPHLQSGS